MSKVNKIMEYPFHCIHNYNSKKFTIYSLSSFRIAVEARYYYVSDYSEDIMFTSIHYKSYKTISYEEIPNYIKEHSKFKKLLLFKKKLESVLYQELMK